MFKLNKQSIEELVVKLIQESTVISKKIIELLDLYAIDKKIN